MGTMKYVLAVDQGSSGTMVALLDQRARLLDSEDIPIGVYTPGQGLVEHDPMELVESIRIGARDLMERHPDKLEDLVGMCLANQGESFLLWDKQTGEPVTQVISWQDSRGESHCRSLQEAGRDSWFHEKTGLHLSAEWPALKLLPLRESDRELRRAWDEGRLAYGQLDAWFLYILTGGRCFATDHSTACRSGLYNLATLGWDRELVQFFGAQGLHLPEIVDSTSRFEGVDLGIGRPLPWVAGALDQSVALVGQHCVRPGAVKVTYGTCCACWMNLGHTPALDDHLTTSVAWKTPEGTVYALAAEGGASGNIVTWLNRNFHTGWPLEELSHIAADSGDEAVVFVPAFNGLAAPYWETEVKGTLFGVTTGTRPEHILRAGLDAVAFTVRDILEQMPAYETLVLDGGMTANDYLVSKQADVLGRPVTRAANREGTVTGIGYLACKSLGFLQSLDSLGDCLEAGETVYPVGSDEDDGYELWKRAIRLSIDYYK